MVNLNVAELAQITKPMPVTVESVELLYVLQSHWDNNNRHANLATQCPSGQSCVSGACALVCPSGQTVCSGSCKNLLNDPNNCGTCGFVVSRLITIAKIIEKLGTAYNTFSAAIPSATMVHARALPTPLRAVSVPQGWLAT